MVPRMYEVFNTGVVELPRQLGGTDAERLAYNTTGLPNGSTWKVYENNILVHMYEWGGNAWNQIF
jgi:hypothetical protein